MKHKLYLILFLGLILQACHWNRDIPETGLILSEHFKNKLYKEFDTVTYRQVFQERLEASRRKLSNPNTLESFYVIHQFAPQLVNVHYVNGGLDTLISYLERSGAHGYNPENFDYQRLITLKSTLDSNKFEKIEELYPVLADLEITAAEALMKYHSMVFYGSLNPGKLLNRYFMPVRRPDSVRLTQVLQSQDLSVILKEIQPKSADYIAFQQELKKYKASDTTNKRLRTILVNMERLRWKIPQKGAEYVEVNIPDFTLHWFKDGDTLSHMKVVVGKVEHATPVMYSKLSSIQVNPIWNIPSSIAKNEIYVHASRDPYYLSNNNMNVYYKGQLVANPDTIQWSRYSKTNLPFQFKQGAGGGNALGKFKFIFKNGSSIYLHDTNSKSGFSKPYRALSHGCVRVERPLEFAEHLVKDKSRYDQLRMEVNMAPLDTTKMKVYHAKMAQKTDSASSYTLKPTWFSAKPQVPLYINYTTAWWDKGVLQTRPDVYGMDQELWQKLRRYL
ncbi:L,D-transpeptidase family protein [Pedobacter sp.]|uniref:L,D-transpeptidase family protein n=1 Tax=Pedobacter sp. TaxID=1411316 RepID=UPI003D7F33EE